MSRVFVSEPFYDYQDHGYFLGFIHATLAQMFVIFGDSQDLSGLDAEFADEVDLIEIQEDKGFLEYDTDNFSCHDAILKEYKWKIVSEGGSIGEIMGSCADYEYCEDQEKIWRVYSQTPPQQLLTGESVHEVANLIRNKIVKYKNIKYDFSKLFLN